MAKRDMFADLSADGLGKYQDRNTQVLREERAKELDARIMKFFSRERSVEWAQSVEDFCRQETIQNEDVFELSLEAHRLPKMKTEAKVILDKYHQEQEEAKRAAAAAAAAEAARIAEEKRKAAAAAAAEAARIAEEKRKAVAAAKAAAEAKIVEDAQAIDRTVEALAQAPRSSYWCGEVRQTDADFKKLPRESRILCKKLALLEQLLKEVAAVEESVSFDRSILTLDRDKKRDAAWTSAVRELYKKLTPALRKYLCELDRLEKMYKKTYEIEYEPVYKPYRQCVDAVLGGRITQEVRRQYADLDSKRKSVSFNLGDYIPDFNNRWSAAGEAVAQENRRVKAEEEKKRLNEYVTALEACLLSVEKTSSLTKDICRTFRDLDVKMKGYDANALASRISNLNKRMTDARKRVVDAEAAIRAREEAEKRAAAERRERERRRQARAERMKLLGKIALVILLLAIGVAAVAVPATIFDSARPWIIGGALMALALFVRGFLPRIFDWDFPKWLGGILFWAGAIAAGIATYSAYGADHSVTAIYAICLGGVALFFSPIGLSVDVLVREGFSDWKHEMDYYYSYEGPLFTYDFITYLVSATLTTLAVYFFTASSLALIVAAVVAVVLMVVILSFYVDMDGVGRFFGILFGIVAIAALIILPIVLFENASAWIVGLLMVALAIFLRHALPKMKDWDFPMWLHTTVSWILLAVAFVCLIRRSGMVDGNVWALCTSLTCLAWGPMGAGLVCLFTSGLEDWVDDMQDPYDYEGGLFASDCVVYFTTVLFTLILVGSLATTALMVATVFVVTFFSLMLLVLCYDDWDDEEVTLTVNVIVTLTALVLLFCGRGAVLCAVAMLVATAIVNLIIWKTTNCFLLGLSDEPDAVAALISFITLVISVMVLVWGYGFENIKIKDDVIVKCYSNEAVIDLSGSQYDDIVAIDKKAFKNCKKLESIILPDNLEEIGASAFYNCKSLEEVVIPDSVDTIGSSAFYGCTSLVEIELPSELYEIEEYTFYSCTSLKTVTLQYSTMIVGKYAFAHTTALETAYMYNVERIEPHAFDYSGVKDVYIYNDDLYYIGYTVFRGDVKRTIHYDGDWSDVDTDSWLSQEWYHKADVVVDDWYGKEQYGN